MNYEKYNLNDLILVNMCSERFVPCVHRFWYYQNGTQQWWPDCHWCINNASPGCFCYCYRFWELQSSNSDNGKWLRTLQPVIKIPLTYYMSFAKVINWSIHEMDDVVCSTINSSFLWQVLVTTHNAKKFEQPKLGLHSFFMLSLPEMY